MAVCAGLFGCIGLAFQSATAAASIQGFAEEGDGAGQFHSSPQGIAIDQESGAVFVVDRENLRVERWSAEGVFERAWGRGVNGETGSDVCVAGERCTAAEAGTGAGEFAGFPAGVAVASSLGLSRVYVVDDRNLRVQEFTADGQFVLMFGKGVNRVTHGNVCTAEEVAACGAGEAGTGPGEFTSLEGDAVAVDQSGLVYVGESNRVEEFTASGGFVGEVALPGAGQVTGVAVDSAKDLYVVASELSGVHKYDSSGAEIPGARDQSASAARTVIAVGPSDELFVYDSFQGHVQEYEASGNQMASFVQEGLGRGLAFGNKLDVLYVLLKTEVAVLVPPPPGPVVVDGSERVENVLPQSATACALVNPEGAGTTNVVFEYGSTTAYGSTTTAALLEGGAFEDQLVCAELTALVPASEYHVRAVAEQGAHTTFGPDVAFTTAAPVSVESESVSHVSGNGARLEAVLNPHGLPGEFHFEYGKNTNYEHTVPIPDGEVFASTAGVAVHATIEGLQPGTVYHYRVAAHDELGTDAGPDETFRTESASSATLADGRQWEMVSPPAKHGSALEALAEEGSDIQAAEDGNGITYVAKAPISEETAGTRSSANSQLLSKRTGAGAWTTQDVTTPHEEVVGLDVGKLSEYMLFSPDLSKATVEPVGTTPLNPALMGERKERTPYRRESDGVFLPLVTEANTPPGVRFGGEEEHVGLFSNGVRLVSMTPDASKVILSSPQPLTEGIAPSVPGAENLYEWNANKLTVVSVMPGGHTAAEEGFSAIALGKEDEQVRGAVSNDGLRAVFEIEGKHLFLRDVGRGETVQLDKPEPGVRPEPGRLVFQMATPDGSRIFFTDTARLTIDSTARGDAPDLYMCDVAIMAEELSCVLSDLSVDRNRNESAQVLGDVIGVDHDGRYVYFVANGALAPGAVHGDCREEAPASASCNLYVRDILAGTTSLVAVLASSDGADWWASPIGSNLSDMTAGVSSNGRFLTFMSTRPLTGFDNRDAISGERDAEVFEFDRERGTLRCVSCDPSGGRPVGVLDMPDFPGLLVDRSRVWAGQTLAGSIPGWTRLNLDRALDRSRYLSDSGRLFFNSPLGLVPADGNGREDVYEFEPSGVGGCNSESGCIALMSSGASSEESAFLDASASGDDVFFLTGARLAAQDVDGALDVYDAHVCSAAVPCAAGVASAPPPCGTTDSCRSAPAAQPDVFGAPASQLFHGDGNVLPRTAAKPKRLSRAQKLARALRACKHKPRKRRAACRARARRLYGPARKERHARRAGVKANGGGQRLPRSSMGGRP